MRQRDGTRPNFAARAGAWSAARWKRAVGLWLAFVIVAFALGRLVGTQKLTDAESASGETAKALSILAQAGFEQPDSESVLVQSPTLTARDPAFRAAVRAVVARVSGLEEVTSVRSPLAAGAGGQISRDGRSALVEFDMRGDPDDAPNHVKPVLDAVAGEQRAHRSFRIEEFGDASSAYELNKTIGQDFRKAETLTVPVTLVILVFAFGALVAASLPVLLAFSGVLGALGISALVSHVFPATDATSSVILLMGMAVGVDYSLFYLRREREERARGPAPRRSLLVTAATSGQAVLISGLTVIIAMAGLLFAGNATFTSIGVGAMVMIAVALIGSLSILPAMLAKLGDRVDRGRIPFVSRLRHDGESRLWSAIMRIVLRRPLVSAVAAGAALVALALPALGMHTKLLSFGDLPRSLGIVRTYDDIQAAFPGAPAPAAVVVRAPNVEAPDVQSGIRDLEREAVATGQMQKPIHVAVSPDRTVANVTIPLAGSGDDNTSVRALETLRNEVIPATVGKVQGATVAVAGFTAGTTDFNHQMKTRAPVIFAFVLGLAFLLLLVTFRSLVLPLAAIVLNLLSVSASYGALVLVFQHGWAQGLLGFHSNGGIVSWLPIFLFVVLFGLSMDYHVFIVSRVKELADGGADTGEAVARGLTRTAGTVTSAAIVMVAVFAVFAGLRTLDIKQLGVGLAIAIFLDATVVRAVLLPATMKLLGDWNWYLPRRLAWLRPIGEKPLDARFAQGRGGR